jgi:hypothetical protein
MTVANPNRTQVRSEPDLWAQGVREALARHEGEEEAATAWGVS